jgi:hypothetical protein
MTLRRTLAFVTLGAAATFFALRRGGGRPRALAGKLRGAAGAPFRRNDYNDPTLVAKVESEALGRTELLHDGVLVNAEDGVIVLRGTVPDGASRIALEERIRAVDGVRGVVNLLHLPHEMAADSPRRVAG